MRQSNTKNMVCNICLRVRKISFILSMWHGWFHTWVRQEFQWLEFFAGVGNLTKMMKASNYRSMRFDLEDNSRPSHRKSNFMDLLHSSGWAILAPKFKTNSFLVFTLPLPYLLLKGLDCSHCSHCSHVRYMIYVSTSDFYNFYINHGPSYQGWLSCAYCERCPGTLQYTSA